MGGLKSAHWDFCRAEKGRQTVSRATTSRDVVLFSNFH